MDLLREFVARQDRLLQEGYWGTILSPLGMPSPRFKSFINSLHISLEFDGTGLSHPGYIGPEAFSWLLENLPAPNFKWSEEEQRQSTVRTWDNAASGYYEAMGMKHIHIPRPGNVQSNMPLLDVKGIAWWISLHLFAGSAEMHQLLYKLLNMPGRPIINPDDGKPFAVGGIPKTCLPETHPGCVELLDEAREKWAQTRKVVIERSKLVPGSASTALFNIAAQNQYQMSVNTAQNIRMQSIASVGATMAAQSAWNTRLNVAKMSWGNF